MTAGILLPSLRRDLTHSYMLLSTIGAAITMTFLCELSTPHLAWFLERAGEPSDHPLGLLQHLPPPAEPEPATLEHLTESFFMSRPALGADAWHPMFRELLQTLSTPRRVIEIDGAGGERLEPKSWYVPSACAEDPDPDGPDVVGLMLFEDAAILIGGVSSRGVAAEALSCPFPAAGQERCDRPAPKFDVELSPEHAMAMALVIDALVLGDKPVARLGELARQAKALRAGTAAMIGGYTLGLQLAGCADDMPDKRRLLQLLTEFEGQGWLMRCGRRAWCRREAWDRSSFRTVGVTRVVSLVGRPDGSVGHRITTYHGAEHGYGLRLERCGDVVTCLALSPQSMEREVLALVQ